MSPLTLRSPAKLNLVLHVVNKRADGYHDLRTVFERISLCDDLSFASRADGRIVIRCGHPHVPTGPKNLVHKVARLLQERFSVRRGADIVITKRIPVAAGLAGGSSNAATALMGLNRLWRLGLSRKELVELGGGIGSDVPFFLYDTSWALGEGRGEHITPWKIRAKLWHVLVTPCVKMYTRDVFGGLNLRLTNKIDNVNILSQSLKRNDLWKVGHLLSNDLESSILRIRPTLLAVKEKLMALKVIGAGFSGSGPSVFAITSSQHDAQRIQSILKKRYRQVFAVRTL